MAYINKKKIYFAGISKGISERYTEGVIIEDIETEDELAGTWLFNDTLTYESVQDTFNFESNGRAYTSLMVSAFDWSDYENAMAYVDSGENPAYYFSSNTWLETGFKTINIISEPTDTAFITWLKANATKQETTARQVTIRINNSYDATFPIPSGATTWAAMDNVYSNNYSNLMIDVVGNYVEIIQSSDIYASGRIFVPFASDVASSDTISADLTYKCTLTHSGGAG